jgi:PPP family 3-phenylpropionic acid transporter
MNNMQQPTNKTSLKGFSSSPRGKQIILWVAFFLFWGGAAAVLPYITLYYESIGLSGRQIGQLSSIPFFVGLASSVTFGFLSDVSRRSKLLLRICVVGIVAVLFFFPRARTFVALVPVVLLYSILHAPTNPILDQTTLHVLEDPRKYGRIRMGGSLGWGMMVLAAGFLIDNLGAGLPVIFYLNILFMALFFFVVGFLPDVQKQKKEDRAEVSLRKLGEMILMPGFLGVFLLIIIWGIGEASISNFLFLHIKHLGGSSALMGTALSISLVGEIVTFSFANKVQEKIGEFRMILLAFIVLFTWLTGLYLIKDPNMIPFFQIFGGAGYALMHSGSVAYVNRRAPKGMGTTAQGLRGGVYAGLGNGVGTLISGALYEFFGSGAMYRAMSVVQVGGLLIGILLYMLEKRSQGRRT